MKAIVRHGKTDDNIQKALDDACSGIKETKGLIVLSFTDLDKISYILMEKYPNAKIIGGGGRFIHRSEIYEEDFLLIFLLDDCDIECGLIRNISTSPADGLMDITKSATEISPGNNNTVCLEFSTGNEEILLSIFRTAFGLNKIFPLDAIKLAGGTIYVDVDDHYNDIVMYNGKTYKDSCVYMMIKNKTGKICIYQEHDYVRADDKTYIASKASFATRIIKEINNQLPANLYKKYMDDHGHTEFNAEFACQYPLGRIVGNEIFPVAQVRLEQDGTLLNHTLVGEGDKICFLRLADNYSEINDDTQQKIQMDIPNPSLILKFECAYRILSFRTRNYIGNYLGKTYDKNNVIGYVCGGEQLGNKHMNMTCLSIVFE